MNWFIKYKIAQAQQTAYQLANEIQEFADQISVAKGQYLQQTSNQQNAAWTPQNVPTNSLGNVGKTQFTDMLNRSWQSVVSAARCLKANNVFDAGNAIATAKELMQNLCKMTDCSQRALSRIMQLLGSCEQRINGLVNSMYA